MQAGVIANAAIIPAARIIAIDDFIVLLIRAETIEGALHAV
jgi:hypothetical protein